MKKSNKKTIIAFLVILVIIGSIAIYGKEIILQVWSPKKYSILVDVEESKLYLLDNGVVTKEYSCAGGKYSTPSPIGTWTIVSKGKWGEGFGGSWLGFDVPWGQFGIHGTTEKYSVGWSSSHGCIRMNNSEVAELYKIIPIGTKVTIIDGVYGDFGKGFRNLKSGMYGADVKAIQTRLKELGFFNGTPNRKVWTRNRRSC